MNDNERLIIESGDAKQPFNYAIGMHGSKFFQEICDNKRIMGIKCPGAARCLFRHGGSAENATLK